MPNQPKPRSLESYEQAINQIEKKVYSGTVRSLDEFTPHLHHLHALRASYQIIKIYGQQSGHSLSIAQMVLHMTACSMFNQIEEYFHE